MTGLTWGKEVVGGGGVLVYLVVLEIYKCVTVG